MVRTPPLTRAGFRRTAYGTNPALGVKHGFPLLKSWSKVTLKGLIPNLLWICLSPLLTLCTNSLTMTRIPFSRLLATTISVVSLIFYLRLDNTSLTFINPPPYALSCGMHLGSFHSPQETHLFMLSPPFVFPETVDAPPSCDCEFPMVCSTIKSLWLLPPDLLSEIL